MSYCLGNNIRTIRKKWRFDQEEFMILIKAKSRQMVSKYENGDHLPPVASMLILENLTGIPMKELLLREIDDEEIPSQPLETPLTMIKITGRSVEEKETEQKLIGELMDLGALIRKVAEHEERIKKLEENKNE